jgi:hypothetical protein
LFFADGSPHLENIPSATGFAPGLPRMASLYREVVLKEKPAVAENGFIPLGALGKANGGIAPAAKPEVAEPVAGD